MRCYVTALLASKTPGGDVETPLSELEHMLTQHMAGIQRLPFGYDYFVHLVGCLNLKPGNPC